MVYSDAINKGNACISDQKGISNPWFIVTLLTKVNSSILTRLTYKIKSLKNLIRRGYLTSTVDSLR